MYYQPPHAGSFKDNMRIELNHITLAKRANICKASARRVRAYKDVCHETALRVATCLGYKITDIFEFSHDHRATLKH